MIDFWAEWCGPCRMLGPVLERLAEDYGGQFVLAKVDTEREPGPGRGFGVRSIPAVFAVRDGQAVNGFVGVQPEAAIRAWLDRLMPTPGRAARRRGAPARGDRSRGRRGQVQRGAVARSRPRSRRRSAWRGSPWHDGRLDDAQARILDMERRRGSSSPRPSGSRPSSSSGSRGRRPAAASRPPAPRWPQQPRRPRAQVPARRGPRRRRPVRRRPGLCLELVERHRKAVGERARQTMVAIFQLLPPDSELVTEYQRQLSMVLMD